MENRKEEVNITLLLQKTKICRDKMEPKDARFFLRKRYLVILSIMLSGIIVTLLLTNLSICLVDMTSAKTITENNITYIKEPEFKWTSMEKGIIISSFSWGFLLFSPIGGLFPSKYRGVKIYSLGIFFSGVVTVLSPILIRTNFYAYSISRFLEGVFQSFSFVCQSDILIRWTPPDERTFLINFAYLGVSIGLIVSYPITGYITYLMDWEATFYITGGVSILWSLVWFFLLKDSPFEDKFITKEERNYFKELNIIIPEEKVIPPWRKILISIPLWALLNDRFVESWTTSFLSFCLPLYIKDVYDVNIRDLGWFSSVPQYFTILGKLPAALLADYLRRNNIWSKTKVHKVYILCAQIGAAICLFISGIANNFLISLVVFCIFRLCFSLAFVSYWILPIDIGGHHSAFVFGLCSTVFCIGAILNPLVIGFIVQNHTFAEWSRYFFFLSTLNVWAAGIFAFFGSGELQLWAVPTESKTETKTSNTSS